MTVALKPVISTTGRCGPQAADSPGQFEPGQVRHGQVDDHQVEGLRVALKSGKGLKSPGDTGRGAADPSQDGRCRRP